MKLFIDCYYLSNIVRQPNHIYYTSYDYMFGEFFYFDLNLCNLDNIRFNTYPYKVRVDSNDVFYIANNGLRALKFQIVEEVNILDWIEASSLKDRTKSHLKSICNGSVPQDKVLEFYDKTIITPTALLTTAQIFKLHAILSQKKYELPTRVITMEIKAICELMNFMAENMNLILIINLFSKCLKLKLPWGLKDLNILKMKIAKFLCMI